MSRGHSSALTHPLAHEWAHSYALYSSPANPRVSTPILYTHHPSTHEWAHSYTLYSSPVGHLMDASPYLWIVHLKSDWARDVWIKGVVWIWYRICIINNKLFYIICFFATYRPTLRVSNHDHTLTSNDFNISYQQDLRIRWLGKYQAYVTRYYGLKQPDNK
jgi:hypothetical protein